MSVSEKKRVPLLLSGGPEVSYSGWPVTQGIPFPDGELAKGTPVRVVDETGRPLPTQAQCLTTWNKDLEYVRWLLVDFQADLKVGEKRQLFLEYGPEAVPPTPDKGVSVRRDDHELVVDTGVMQVRLRNTPYRGQIGPAPGDRDFFAGCTLETEEGRRELFQGDPGLHLYMKDQHGNNYDSCTAGPRPQVIVEESGPLRACICIKGHHAARQGQRFCPYVLRLHFFAGKSDIHIFHTFVFDQEPHAIELAAIGMRLPLDLGNSVRSAIGGEASVHAAGDGLPMALLQRDDRQYEVTSGGRLIEQGRRSAGWASLSGKHGSAAAVIRDHWQEYPKGFALGPDGLDVQVWPEACGETLKFSTPFEEPAVRFDGTRDEEEVKRILAEHPTGPLNVKSFYVPGEPFRDAVTWIERVLDKYAPDRIATYNDTETYNGVGAAKTTELALRLSTSPIEDDEAQCLCACVQDPACAIPDPAYVCATRAAGHAYHAGDPRFAEVDSALDDMMQLAAVEPIEKGRLYGMMRYGNMVCSHSWAAGAAYVYYKDSNPGKVFRRLGPYNNEANDQIGAVWTHFLRTGRREDLLLAQRYGRNVADVGFIHAHPSCPERVGLMHYHSAHQWSGGPSPSHSIIRGLLLDYYLTGNRRLLDVALETADWVVRTQTPCGIVSCGSGSLHREFTGPVWTAMEAFQATWKEKYGDVARRSLNWFLRVLPRPGHYPCTLGVCGERGDEAVVAPDGGPLGHARDVYALFEAALRLFDSRALRRHVISEADYHARRKLPQEIVEHHCLLGNFSIACLAYDLTGDPVYAVAAKDHIESVFLRKAEAARRFEDFGFSQIGFGSAIPRLVRIVADAMDKDADGFAKIEREWRRKMAAESVCELPDRRLEPLTRLGSLSTADHDE